VKNRKSVPSAASIDTPNSERSLAEQIASRRKALTVQEFSDLLSLAPTTVYDWARNGSLPCFRLGGAIRLDPKTVADWLRAQEG
jgi:excisionase family DNA binding protein